LAFRLHAGEDAPGLRPTALFTEDCARMPSLDASLAGASWISGVRPAWLAGLLILAVAAVLLLGLHAVILRVLKLVLRGRLAAFGETLLARLGPPTRLGLVVIGLSLVVQLLPWRGGIFALVERGLLFAFVVALGWTAIATVNAAADLYLRRIPAASEDSALTRKHLTQVRLLRRIAVIVIGFLTLAAVLMTIPAVRQYGVSLFASAGVAGLAVGLAARPLLSNLIAGVQIAVTQPIRLGDGILIEGEFGHVEEIQTSYVVVALSEGRRLVVPLSYFVEKPFQNWTRESSSLSGTVTWVVDYSVPVAEVRAKFLEFVKDSAHWDGRIATLQVAEAGEHKMTLRGTVSATSAAASGSLRAEVRERMIAWLLEAYPSALPHATAKPAADRVMSQARNT
jgi:small-conductance mechanosensitive channel